MSYVAEIEDFITEEERRALVDELLAASAEPSTVLGGGVENRARKSRRVAVSDATRTLIEGKLRDAMPELAEHFGVPLTSWETPQFLRYDEGDFFVPHQDGNTPLVHDESRHRRLSAVIFLSDRSQAAAEGAYGGGELVFHGRYVGAETPTPVAGTPRSMVVFRSEETHEVTAVTHGVRFTVAVFYR
jgi:SM-20-related protein